MHAFVTAIQNEEEADVVREAAKILAKDEKDGIVLNGLWQFFIYKPKDQILLKFI